MPGRGPKARVARAGLRGARIRRLLVATLLPALWLGPASAPAPAAPQPGSEHRIYIGDMFTKAAVRWALADASRWLDDTRCRAIFSDFQDGTGRRLDEKLAELGQTGQDYLAVIQFRDGTRSSACGQRTLAFTSPGAPVVFVCGRHFERAWRASPRLAQAVLLHEVLHTLGLGENPPTSEAITYHVLQQCSR